MAGKPERTGVRPGQMLRRHRLDWLQNQIGITPVKPHEILTQYRKATGCGIYALKKDLEILKDQGVVRMQPRVYVPSGYVRAQSCEQ